MRPLAVAAWLATLALLVAACDVAAGGERGDHAPVRVVASFSVIADFVEAVGGDAVVVDTLVPVGGDPHDYEPRPGDATAIADADVVFRNGYALEPSLDALFEAADTPVVTLAEALEADTDERGEPDPHLWMAPPNVAVYVEAIEETLRDLDPGNGDHYAANAERYRVQLADLDEEIAATLDTVPVERRRIVTSHDAYSYFAEHYGWEVLETVVGISTEEEPSARTVRRIIDKVRAEDVPTIFVETTVNPSVIERIARDAGVEVGDPLFGDSVGEPGTGADTYGGMMRANAAALARGLGGDPS